MGAFHPEVCGCHTGHRLRGSQLAPAAHRHHCGIMPSCSLYPRTSTAGHYDPDQMDESSIDRWGLVRISSCPGLRGKRPHLGVHHTESGTNLSSALGRSARAPDVRQTKNCNPWCTRTDRSAVEPPAFSSHQTASRTRQFGREPDCQDACSGPPGNGCRSRIDRPAPHGGCPSSTRNVTEPTAVDGSRNGTSSTKRSTLVRTLRQHARSTTSTHG